MEITTFNEGKYYIIKINGELDASSSLILDDAIEEAVNKDQKLLLFDCENLHYITWHRNLAQPQRGTIFVDNASKSEMLSNVRCLIEMRRIRSLKE